MEKGFLIGESLLTRIKTSLDRADGQPIRLGDAAIPTRLQDVPRGRIGNEPRLGTIAATWAKGQTATVTQIKADGTALSPTVEFNATNWFAAVTVASGTKKVLCVFVGDRWLLIAAEC
jgi:hypothetical protein